MMSAELGHWSASLVRALGWMLIHTFWQGFLIAAVVLILGHRRTADRRYLIFGAGMALLLVCALINFGVALGGRSEVPSYKVGTTVTAVEGTPGFSTRVPPLPDRQPSPGNWNSVVFGLGSLWLSGAFLMGIRALRAGWTVRTLRRGAKAWMDEVWQEKVRSWTRELGIRRGVRLCLTTLNDAPAVIGYFKPIILLPAAIVTRLGAAELETLLLHELEHIRRHDYLVNVLQLVCETLLFFHPIAWWFSGCMRREREHCCDERVAKASESPVLYAKALLALEEWRLNSAGGLALGAGDGSLKVRVARLLSPPAPRARTAGGWLVTLAALALLGSLSLLCWPPAVAQVPAKPHLFEVRRVVDQGGDELRVVGRAGAPSNLHVASEVLLNQTHVRTAKAELDPVSKQYGVRVTLNNEGAKRFAKATRDNVGKELAIVINNQIISAPRVNEPIAGGQLVITGSFTKEDAEELAKALAPESTAKTSAGEPSASSIRLETYFIKVPKEPSTIFTLRTQIDSASDNLAAWSLTQEEAHDLLRRARDTAGTKIIWSPSLSTSPGTAVRVEMGAIPDQDGAFSVNATGYITSKEPEPQLEPNLIGQSIELLPEFSKNYMIVAGKFIDRERVALREPGQKPNPSGPFVLTTRHSAPFYVTIPKASAFALGQKSSSSEGYLLLLVVPHVDGPVE